MPNCCVTLSIIFKYSSCSSHARLFLNMLFQFVIEMGTSLFRIYNVKARMRDCCASWRDCVSEAPLNRRALPDAWYIKATGEGPCKWVKYSKRPRKNPSTSDKRLWRFHICLVLQAQSFYWLLPSQSHLQRHRLQARFSPNRVIRPSHSTCR